LTLYTKKGGQCSFYLKVLIFLENIRFLKQKIGSKFDTTKKFKEVYL